MLSEPGQTRRKLIPINYDTIFCEGLSNVFCHDPDAAMSIVRIRVDRIVELPCLKTMGTFYSSLLSKSTSLNRGFSRMIRITRILGFLRLTL